MAFALPADETGLAQSLRDAESTAPKNLKPLLERAAQVIDEFKTAASDAVVALEQAASLRVGVMDSQARVDDIANEVRQSMLRVIEQMRELA